MTPASQGPHLDAVHVVIPAHDEEELLPRCLESVTAALQTLLLDQPGLATRITVVADRCRDRTLEIALGHHDTEVVETAAGCVGAARRAGVARVTDEARLDGSSPDRVWLAHTDADTVVPPHWLVAQARLARRGFAMVVGTVRPEQPDLTPRAWRTWHERHRAVEGHPHVHGANLGLSLEASLAVDGFPALAVHEDVHLVEAVRRAGFRWCATATTEVVTSGRRRGRLEGGFASYLAALEEPDVVA